MTEGSRQRIGPYEVRREIGRGGMGVVYLARDSKLERDVAIKVLPDEVAQDSERLGRFEREAKLLASLNHPNIATVHGLEEVDGRHCLVLEYVEGETLEEVLRRGPMPVAEALTVAKEIAEAIEYAHEQGVIHRDLKPANIKFTGEELVKVLDFGLAKALEQHSSSDVADSPTLVPAHSPTTPGVVLGTAGYLSPEQARGRTVDRRSDIWSFGCLLYEMLTGRQMFVGETVADSIGATLHRAPDWNSLPGDTPPTVQLLLRRCLTRDRKKRLHDIGDARIELEEALADPTGSSLSLAGAALAAARPARASIWRRTLPWGLAAVLAVVSLMAAWRLRTATHPTPGPVVRFPIDAQPAGGVALLEYPAVALSPDGTRLAFTGHGEGGSQIFLRKLGDLEATPVPGTEGGRMPFFSPDGKWLGFFGPGELMKVPTTGGAVVELVGVSVNPRGASWVSDDTIIFVPGVTHGLQRIPASGGRPTSVTEPDADRGERTHRWPQVLPDGSAAIFTVGTLDSSESYEDATIEAVSLQTGERQVIYEGASFARYVPSGHLICARGGSLTVVPFDLATLRVTGNPVTTIEGVAGVRSSGAVNFAVSQQGSLAFVPGTMARRRGELIRIDRAGTVEVLPASANVYREPALSPDGDRVAVAVTGERTYDIWIYDITSRKRNRLTFEGSANVAPVWTPDGHGVFFASDRIGQNTNIFRKAADGSGEAELVLADEATMYPYALSLDGRLLAADRQDAAGNFDLWITPADGTGDPQPLLDSRFDECQGAFSPDGRWLAYSSNETGRYEVYVRPLSGAGGRWQVSSDGGTEPRWSPDGRRLFYLDDTRLMEVPVETEPGFSAGTPSVLLDGVPIQGSGARFNYSVGPKAESFVLFRRFADNPQQITFVLNWAQELRRLGP